MKEKTYSFILVLLFIVSSCATHAPVIKNNEVPQTFVNSKQTSDTVILDHTHFKISYNKSKRLAQYVVYQLSASQLKKKTAKRNNKFIPDPYLINNNIPYVSTSEYNKSGYDRGHLAPSADFAWDQDANNITFVMSNMVPQSPGLNRDSWKKLEDQVRKWACGEEKITIITGPVLTKNLPTLKSGLEIPQEFFKIIIDETAPKKSLAFIYHQADRGNVLRQRIVPVKNVELITGIAFHKDFPELGNEKIRGPANLNEWKEADCKE